LRRFIPITLCQIKRSFGNQATIEYNGQLYKTSPIKINVTAAVEPKDPNDTSVSADNNIYLVADISKMNPYVNEPITIVYIIFY
jgi:hypothetical protein